MGSSSQRDFNDRLNEAVRRDMQGPPRVRLGVLGRFLNSLVVTVLTIFTVVGFLIRALFIIAVLLLIGALIFYVVTSR